MSDKLYNAEKLNYYKSLINNFDEFLEEVKAVLTAVQENNELIKLISHPKIAKEEKIQAHTKATIEKIKKTLDLKG